MRNILGFWMIAEALLMLNPGNVCAQFSYNQVPLINVVKDLNERTEYILLYREALLEGIIISLEAEQNDVFDRLKKELEKTTIDLLIDKEHKQVVFFKNKKQSQKRSLFITGEVVDAKTGERLPFSTISWETGEKIEGVSANEAGYFVIRKKIYGRQLEVKASYIGYQSQSLILDLTESSSIDNFTFRLQQKVSKGGEIIVNGFYQYSYSASTQNTIDIAKGNILGEPNTIKALQFLPSVGLSTALNEGVNVRGSPADGFQLLLDGITLYNQTHLFGLFDNLNSDALQTSGLFYDVAPASYQAPIGGTLALITKTGSLNNYKFTTGISNTSLRATAEGPIKKGKASFLLSGRTSYLDKVNWFGNSKLVQWGLDVDRPRKKFSSGLTDVQLDLIQTKNTNASFADIHSKVYLESKSGTRFMLSTYYGFDNVSIDALRLFRSFNSTDGSRTEFEPVNTKNVWNNGKISGHIQKKLFPNVYSRSTIGLSMFKTDYNKDDFTYTQVDPSSGALESFTSSLEIKSIVNEIIAKQDFEITSSRQLYSFGLSYQFLSGEYFEDSFERPFLFLDDQAHKADAYVHSEFRFGKIADFKGGIRAHYYSNGNYLKWSPRTKVRFFPESRIQLGGGYSKNYQFMNQVSFSNILSSNVWILVNENQPPASVDNFTAGIYFNLSQLGLFQIEGYVKNYKYLRLHEIDTYSVSNAFGVSPWFADNSGIGKGIEFQLINPFNRFEINQSFSLSSMKLENESINNGDPFPVNWDRTYQYSGTLSLQLMDELSLKITQFYASGTPNKLSIFGVDDKKRLDDYYRTDLSVDYRKAFKKTSLEFSFSIYNLLNRENQWYREQSFILDKSGEVDQFLTVPSDVYDLGIQPSFSLSISF